MARRMIVCKNCGKEAENKGRGMCSNCYNKQRPKKICSMCGQLALIDIQNETESICKKCYARNRPKEKCYGCEENKVIVYRKDEPLCRNCYRKLKGVKKEICSACNELKTVNSRTSDGAPLCSNCYTKTKPKEECSKCLKLEIIVFRSNNIKVCSICYGKYYRPKKICSICSRNSIVAKYNNLQPICGTCYKNQNMKKCHICNMIKPVNKTVDNKHFCTACYMRDYTRPKKICGCCGKLDIIEKIYNGVQLCSSCHRNLPEVKVRHFNCRQKYRLLRDNSGKITLQDWLKLMKTTDWKCFYCEKSISFKKNRTLDHIIPISKNGKTAVENLVPCCRSCNASKGNRNIEFWLKQKNIVLSDEKLKKLGVYDGI